ncbi:vitamin B12 dependent-methionine synthase activation domain-containing protein [Bdellovibrio bacteriovorus]|uniref:vitamin B12 dependent-methionine synthase activation domain-containing protein n=1 Tax=Bdellovibrio bacteriovorus TaxID=959 RepID=UPI0035A98D77
MLANLIEGNRVRLQSLADVFEAKSQDDEVLVFDEAGAIIEKLRFDRQTRKKVANNDTYYCLADFVAPLEVQRRDHIGMFVVTAGEQVDEIAKEFEMDNDDYSSILVKAIGDRIAEALAEYTHKKVRGIFGIKEDLSNKDLIAEKYRGIRPAPGYPACPDHSEKKKMWKLLGADERTCVRLTENFAMTPPSSVSGYYFMHPDAKCFAI